MNQSLDLEIWKEEKDMFDNDISRASDTAAINRWRKTMMQARPEWDKYEDVSGLEVVEVVNVKMTSRKVMNDP